MAKRPDFIFMAIFELRYESDLNECSPASPFCLITYSYACSSISRWNFNGIQFHCFESLIERFIRELSSHCTLILWFNHDLNRNQSKQICNISITKYYYFQNMNIASIGFLGFPQSYISEWRAFENCFQKRWKLILELAAPELSIRKHAEDKIANGKPT